MKIKNEAFGRFPVEMKRIDPDAWFHIEKIFAEGHIVFELEILF
jgi:hypothetical protein